MDDILGGPRELCYNGAHDGHFRIANLSQRFWTSQKITAAIWVLLMSSTAPDDPSDLVVTVEAEDKHDFQDRLAEIRALTLVIAGARDPFYTEALLRETAVGIPNAWLILYAGKGHAPAGKQFSQDVLTFLNSG
jgi:pimeloyl-ACP methyl ester carboxylesterase